ncbi:hypothetical protein G6F40_017174 [Rhizopus arrhizus]|nr:hypothetical protein G6F40_017174 [Rhizopus arrhizus]
MHADCEQRNRQCRFGRQAQQVAVAVELQVQQPQSCRADQKAHDQIHHGAGHGQRIDQAFGHRHQHEQRTDQQEPDGFDIHRISPAIASGSS